MKNLFITLLAGIVFVTSSLVGGFTQTEVKPYVAVFTTSDLAWIWVKSKIKPDKLKIANGWSEFEPFCKQVNNEAKGRPVLLDLTVHGNDDGLALSLGWIFYDVTTVGRVVNIIERNLDTTNLKVFLEACYSGNAYYYTIRGNHKDPSLDHKGIPSFPIYGVGSGYSNWGPSVFFQYYYKDFRYFTDLRTYEVVKPEVHEKDDEFGFSPTLTEIMIFFYYLYSKEVDKS